MTGYFHHALRVHGSDAAGAVHVQSTLVSTSSPDAEAIDVGARAIIARPSCLSQINDMVIGVGSRAQRG